MTMCSESDRGRDVARLRHRDVVDVERRSPSQLCWRDITRLASSAAPCQRKSNFCNSTCAPTHPPISC